MYVLLSALDFPFCFIAVRMLGTERIGHWEGVVVEWFWWGVAAVVPERMGKLGEVVGEGEGEGKTEEYAVIGPGEVAVGVPVGSGAGIDHGVQEAEERNKREDASKSPYVIVVGRKG